MAGGFEAAASDSRITFPTAAKPARLFTVKSADLVAICPNAAAYDTPRSHLPPLEPAGGWKVRHYPLDVPDAPGHATTPDSAPKRVHQ